MFFTKHRLAGAFFCLSQALPPIPLARFEADRADETILRWNC
jgi:hypothetical protein